MHKDWLFEMQKLHGENNRWVGDVEGWASNQTTDEKESQAQAHVIK